METPDELRRRLQKSQETNRFLEAELAELREFTKLESQFMLLEEGCSKLGDERTKLVAEVDNLTKSHAEFKNALSVKCHEKKNYLVDLVGQRVEADISREIALAFDDLANFLDVKGPSGDAASSRISTSTNESLISSKTLDMVQNELSKIRSSLKGPRRLSDSSLVVERFRKPKTATSRCNAVSQTEADTFMVAEIDTPSLLDSSTSALHGAGDKLSEALIPFPDVHELELKLAEMRAECHKLGVANDNLKLTIDDKCEEIQELMALLDETRATCTCKPMIRESEDSFNRSDVNESRRNLSSYLPTILEASFDGSDMNDSSFALEPNAISDPNLGEHVREYTSEMTDLQKCNDFLTSELNYCLSEVENKDEQITMLQALASPAMPSELLVTCNQELEALETLFTDLDVLNNDDIKSEVVGRLENALSVIQKYIDSSLSSPKFDFSPEFTMDSSMKINESSANESVAVLADASFPQQLCSAVFNASSNTSSLDASTLQNPESVKLNKIMNEVRNLRNCSFNVISNFSREMFEAINKLARLEYMVQRLRCNSPADGVNYKGLLLKDIKEKADALLGLDDSCGNYSSAEFSHLFTDKKSNRLQVHNRLSAACSVDDTLHFSLLTEDRQATDDSLHLGVLTGDRNITSDDTGPFSVMTDDEKFTSELCAIHSSLSGLSSKLDQLGVFGPKTETLIQSPFSKPITMKSISLLVDELEKKLDHVNPQQYAFRYDPECTQFLSMDVSSLNADSPVKRILQTSQTVNQNEVGNENKENTLKNAVRNYNKLIVDSKTRIEELEVAKNDAEMKVSQKLADCRALSEELKTLKSELILKNLAVSEKFAEIERLNNMIRNQDENLKDSKNEMECLKEELRVSKLNQAELALSSEALSEKISDLELKLCGSNLLAFEKEGVENQLAKTSADLLKVTENITVLENKAKMESSEREKLHDDVRLITEDLLRATERNSALESNLNMFNLEKEELENTLRRTSEELVKASERVIELEKTAGGHASGKEVLQIELDHVSEKLTKASARIIELEATTTADAAIKETLQMNLDSISEKLSKSEERIRELELQPDVDDQLAELDALRTELVHSTEKLSKASEKIAELELTLIALFPKKESLQKEMKHAADNLVNATERMSELELTINSKVHETETLQTELSLAKEIISELESAAETMISDSEKLQNELSITSGELADANEKMTELKEELSISQAEKEAVQNRLFRLSEEMSEVTEIVSTLKLSVSLLESEKKSIENELATASEQLSKDNEKINELKLNLLACAKSSDEDDLQNKLDHVSGEFLKATERNAEMERELLAGAEQHNLYSTKLEKEVSALQHLIKKTRNEFCELIEFSSKQLDLLMTSNRDIHLKLCIETAKSSKIISELTHKLAFAEAEIAELESGLCNANAQMLMKQLRIEELEAEISDNGELFNRLQDLENLTSDLSSSLDLTKSNMKELIKTSGMKISDLEISCKTVEVELHMAVAEKKNLEFKLAETSDKLLLETMDREKVASELSDSMIVLRTLQEAMQKSENSQLVYEQALVERRNENDLLRSQLRESNMNLVNIRNNFEKLILDSKQYIDELRLSKRSFSMIAAEESDAKNKLMTELEYSETMIAQLKEFIERTQSHKPRGSLRDDVSTAPCTPLSRSTRSGGVLDDRSGISCASLGVEDTSYSTVNFERSVFVSDLPLERTICVDSVDPLSMTLMPHGTVDPLSMSIMPDKHVTPCRKMFSDDDDDSSDESNFGTPVASKWGNLKSPVDQSELEKGSLITAARDQIRCISNDIASFKLEMKTLLSETIPSEITESVTKISCFCGVLFDQISKKDLRIAELGDTNDKLRETVLTGTSEKESLREVLKKERNAADILKSQLKDLEMDNHLLIEERDVVQMQVNSLEKSIEEVLRLWYQDEFPIAEDATQELKSLVREVSNAKTLISEYLNTPRHMNFFSEVKSLLLKSETLDRTLAILKTEGLKKCKDLTDECKDLKDECNQIIGDTASFRTEIQETMQKIAVAVVNTTLHDTKTEGLEAQLQTYKSRIATLEAELEGIETLQGQLRVLSDENNSLVYTNSRLSQDIQERERDLSEKIASLLETNSELDGKLSATECELAESHEKIKELTSASSCAGKSSLEIVNLLSSLVQSTAGQPIDLTSTVDNPLDMLTHTKKVLHKSNDALNAVFSLLKINEASGIDALESLYTQLKDSDIRDVYMCKKIFSNDIYSLEPEMRVEDLVKLSLMELHSKLVNAIMEKEQLLIQDVQAQCENKLASKTHALSQYEEREKYMNEMIEDLTKENEKLEKTVSELQSNKYTKSTKDSSCEHDVHRECSVNIQAFKDNIESLKDKNSLLESSLEEALSQHEKLIDQLSQIFSNLQILLDGSPNDEALTPLCQIDIKSNLKEILRDIHQKIYEQRSKAIEDQLALAELDKQYKGLENEHTACGYAASALQAKFEDLSHELDSKVQQVCALSAEKTHLETEIEGLKKTATLEVGEKMAAASEATIADLNFQLEMSAKYMEQLESRESSAEKTKNELVQKVGDLSRERDGLKEAFSKLLSDAKADVNKTVSNVEMRTHLALDLGDCLEEVKIQIDSLKKRYSEVSEEKLMLEASIKMESNEKVRLQDKVKLLEDMLSNPVHDDEKCPFKDHCEVFNREKQELQKLLSVESDSNKRLLENVRHLEERASNLIHNDESCPHIELKAECDKLRSEKQKLEIKLLRSNEEKDSLLEKTGVLEGLSSKPVHDDKSCSYKEKVQEYKRELWIFRTKAEEEKKNFDIMKKNLQEDLAYKSSTIKELEDRIDATINGFKQRLASSTLSYNQVTQKLEDAEERISFLREMNSQDKKRFEKDKDGLSKEISRLQTVKVFLQSIGVESDKIQEALPEMKKKLCDYDRLEAELAKIEERNNELDKECDDMCAEIKLLQSFVGEKCEETEELKKGEEKLRKELADIHDLMDKYKNLENQLALKVQSEAQLSEALRLKDSQLNDISRKLAEESQARNQLENAFKLVESNLESRNQKINQLVSQMKNSEMAMVEKSSLIEELKSTISQKSKLLEELNLAVETEKSKAAAIHGPKLALEEQLSGLQKELASCKSRLGAVPELEAKFQKLSLERDEALRRFQEIESRMTMVQKKMQDYNQQIATLKEERKTLMKSREDAEQNWKAQRFALIDEINNLKNAISDKTARIIEMESVMASQNDVVSHQAKISELQDEVARLQKELAQQTSNFARPPIVVRPSPSSSQPAKKSLMDCEDHNMLEKKCTVLKRLAEKRRTKILFLQNILTQHNIVVPLHEVST